MMQPLKLLSLATLESLVHDVSLNLERYASGTFDDLAREYGWAVEIAAAKWDDSAPSKLNADLTADAEIENSLLIYRSLPGMTPAMARDERVWTRLCHIECIEYVRKRWLKAGSLDARVHAHFFASGMAGCRDDNAIGRLWWNAHIAKLANPDDVELALKRLLARANIRLQVIDRADTAFRQPLIAGIVRILGDDWFASNDAAIADFMFEVNKASGGIIFEALSAEAVDAHLVRCLSAAKARSKSV